MAVVSPECNFFFFLISKKELYSTNEIGEAHVHRNYIKERECAIIMVHSFAFLINAFCSRLIVTHLGTMNPHF